MYSLFTRLLNMSLAAGLMVLVILTLRFLLKKAPRKFVCLLWALVALRLILPVSVSSSLSAFNLLKVNTDDAGQVEYFRYSQTPGKPELLFDHPRLVNDNYSSDSMTVGTKTSDLYLPPLTTAWLLGTGCMLACAAFSYLRVRRETSASILLYDYANEKVELRRKKPSSPNPHSNMDLSSITNAEIFICDDIVSPFILGVFKPRIFLPSGLNPSTRENVVAHEMAHLKRRDHWWKPLGYLLLSVYWFNPLIWLAYVLLCRDVEAACDERVVAGMDRDGVTAYSKALLACAVNGRMITACPLAFGETDVKGRVKNVLSYQKPAFWIICLAVVLCIAAAVCLLTNPQKDGDGTQSSGASQTGLELEILDGPGSMVARMTAVITEIGDGVMVVTPVDDSWELNASDLFTVSLEHMPASLEPQVGDTVEITYDGSIMETYPATLGNVTSVEVVERAGDHQFIQYTQNPDGTYTSEEGIIYKYLLTLTGRSPNADCDSYFVVLSNDPDLEFTRVSESLYTSDSSRFLDREEAVIVKLGVIGDGGAEETAPDTEADKNTSGIVVKPEAGGPDPNMATGDSVSASVPFTSAVAWANWTDDQRIYSQCLNPETMAISSVPHLPVYRLDTRTQLEDFCKTFAGVLTMDQGLDEVPSFENTVAAFDDAFFADHSLILAYVSAGSSSYRYGVGGVGVSGDALCMSVVQLNNPETGDCMMAGWFAMAAVSKADIAGYGKTDAILLLHFAGNIEDVSQYGN